MKQLLRQPILFAPLFFMLVSCVIEDRRTESPIPGGDASSSVSIELFTRAYGFSSPASRSAANEFEVEQTPWVLVFKGSDDNAQFVEAAQAYRDNLGKVFVNLIPQTEVCRLLITANTGAFFYLRQGGVFNAYPADYETFNAALFGMTLSEVCSTLYTAPLDDPQIGRPFVGQTLPMSYLYTASGGLNSGTVIDDNGSALGMLRAVAKLYIRNEAPGFTLLEIVQVGDAAPRGLLYNLDSTPPDDLQRIEYRPASGSLAYVNAQQSTQDDPLYLYESPDNTTFVIVRGVYGTRPYYYKMALSALLRNREYACVIRRIAAPGHLTLEDAVVARAANLIDFDIEVTDLSAYEIIANNEFYLGVSNSVFIAYTPFGTPYHIFEAFAVSNDCTVGFPNANQLNSVNLWGDPMLDVIDPASIPLGASQTVTIGFPDVLGSDTGKDPVFVNLRLGNLEKNVYVRRHGSIPAEGSIFTLQNFYSVGGLHTLAAGRVETGAEWIALAAGDQPGDVGAVSDRIVLNTPGAIYIHIGPNTTGQQRTGYLFFTAAEPSFESNLVAVPQGRTYNIRVVVVQEP